MDSENFINTQYGILFYPKEKICMTFDGCRMYNIIQGHSNWERKVTLFSASFVVCNVQLMLVQHNIEKENLGKVISNDGEILNEDKRTCDL